MKKFDPTQFESYTIAGNGWNYNIDNKDIALKEWKTIQVSATLYGNRPNGTRAILDTK